MQIPFESFEACKHRFSEAFKYEVEELLNEPHPPGPAGGLDGGIKRLYTHHCELSLFGIDLPSDHRMESGLEFGSGGNGGQKYLGVGAHDASR